MSSCVAVPFETYQCGHRPFFPYYLLPFCADAPILVRGSGSGAIKSAPSALIRTLVRARASGAKSVPESIEEELLGIVHVQKPASYVVAARGMTYTGFDFQVFGSPVVKKKRRTFNTIHS